MSIQTFDVSKKLRVKLFADGADLSTMLRLYSNLAIRGFTTNPTLMRKAGITEYEAFALSVLEAIPDRPISFEVFADEATEMERQARRIASWGPTVYVKLPITNTKGQSMLPLAAKLSGDGIQVNVTAILTGEQIQQAVEHLAGGAPAYISIFAGRIADTGVDPIPLMQQAVELTRPHGNLELIWASPRQVLNVIEADRIGCHIITATSDVLSKLPLLGKDLAEYSLETVSMFYGDGQAAGFSL
ncbi:MAG: transaldolase [Acidobacteria bacterium]|nr:transaldolase [Acidobacteriota bacterium]